MGSDDSDNDAHPTGARQPETPPPRTQPPSAAPDVVAAVRQIAESSWARDVVPGDQRFALQGIPHGRSLAEHATTALESGAPASELRQIASTTQDARQTHSEIANSRFEDQLTGLLAASTNLSGQRLDAVMARLGWLSDPPLTLQAAGLLIGLTRQRLNQIETNTRYALPRRPWLPALDTALDLLAEAAPISEDQAAALLVEAGVATAPIPPAALLRAAADLGREPRFNPDALRDGHFLFCGELPAPISDIVFRASRCICASGAASIETISGELTRRGTPIDPSLVELVVKLHHRFVDVGDGWFAQPGAPPPRDRLANDLRKMLSVAQRLPLDSIIDGLQRDYRFQNSGRSEAAQASVPPLPTLAAYVRGHPDFQLSRDQVRLTEPLNHHDQLGRDQAALVDVLLEAPGGSMARRACINECAARGLNTNTMNIYLTYSCVVEHLPNGDWAARRGA